MLESIKIPYRVHDDTFFFLILQYTEMETICDNWLDYLVKHSIFELDDAEKRCSQTIQSKQTRQDSNVVNFILQHHSRVIAVRDNDLFVAIASQIRVLNLSNFKDNWLKAAKEANDKEEELPDSWMLAVPYKVKAWNA